MTITTILFYELARKKWGLSRIIAVPICGFFFLIVLAFWIANVFKIPNGGWFPLVIGMIIFTFMTTWKKGRMILSKRLKLEVIPIPTLIKTIQKKPPHRVPGIALFLSSNPSGTPPALVFILRHMQVLHKKVVLLSVITKEIPHVLPSERVEITDLYDDIYRITIHYGFMENPDIPRAISDLKLRGSAIRLDEITYVLGREHLIPSKRPGMALWREKLFAVMAHNSRSAAIYFQIPIERVIEIGIQLDI